MLDDWTHRTIARRSNFSILDRSCICRVQPARMPSARACLLPPPVLWHLRPCVRRKEHRHVLRVRAVRELSIVVQKGANGLGFVTRPVSATTTTAPESVHYLVSNRILYGDGRLFSWATADCRVDKSTSDKISTVKGALFEPYTAAQP